MGGRNGGGRDDRRRRERSRRLVRRHRWWRDGGAGATAAGATDCTEKERAAECDEFATFDWARQRATWYGPGFFGNQTACGKTLARRTTGVAHRTLPCGSKVVIAYEGRYVRTKVIDRGPFANGAKWDLTQATARALEFEYTDHIRVAKLGA